MSDRKDRATSLPEGGADPIHLDDDRVHLPARDASVSIARRIVIREVSWAGRADLADRAELIVSELATNSVRETLRETRRADEQGSFSLLVRLLADKAVRIEVGDRAPGEPTPREAAALDEGGRGLLLVAAMSDEYGCARHEGGKITWAVLR
ncbi:ATP-binding protein [Actinomadura craniellae]|uniref:ATP-binding protein n=1 Tax=Actinomadura craniellae TaxID=2231787 RepID=UPI0013145BEF|nr:ATP-binding protein [Actinomadura craniellae]